MFRQDSQIFGYDEPFHPRLMEGSAYNKKGTATEFDQLFSSGFDKKTIENVPIDPASELMEQSSAEQKAWLGYLFNAHERVAIDVVRGWNRLPSLHDDCGDLVCVHIVRNPIGWCSAHLLPTGAASWKRRVSNLYRKKTYFSRYAYFNNYQYQEIINSAILSNHRVFSFVKLSARDLYYLPGYYKLLAFWWGANCLIAKGLSYQLNLCHTLSLEQFLSSPKKTLAPVLEDLGWQNTAANSSEVRPRRQVYAERDYRWREAGKLLGIPTEAFDHGTYYESNLYDLFYTQDPIT